MKSFCFLAALILLGCKKDNDSPEETPDVIKISGKVLDENKKAVSGSLVELGDRTTTTDAEGNFVFEEVPTNTHLYVIKVSQPGYFTRFKTAIADRKTDVALKFQIIPQNVAGSFQSGTGGTLAIAGGGSVLFYGGTFIRAKDNAAYNG